MITEDDLPSDTHFRQGYAAFARGNLDNPYDGYKEFYESREWQRGYNAAYSDRLRRQKNIEALYKYKRRT